MLSWLPSNFKRKAKSRWKSLRIAISRKSRGFSKRQLVQMLQQLGVKPGDTLLVHSSLDQFGAFLGKPTDILLALQEAIGPNGTLLMPTLPFTGSAIEYIRTPRVFDVRRTPSQTGLLSELLRRSPGTIRSVHPTHAVAAWGAHASEMVHDHHAASMPCGRQTPYGRLLNHAGKLLFLGADISAMTFFHTVEEILEPLMPFSPFTREVFSLESRDGQGNAMITQTRLFEPKYSQCRNLERLVRELKCRGWWFEARRGGLKAILVNADQVLDVCSALGKRGIFCYDV